MSNSVSDLKKEFKKNMQEEDPLEVRNRALDALLQTKFQLTATGSLFKVGEEAHPEYADVLFVLNRLYALGYADQYKLLPSNIEPAFLASALSKEVVIWLVPMVCMSIDRKVMAGDIDIVSGNNKNLVLICHVLAWYWHKELHGPRPVVASMVKTQKVIRQIVQNAPLVCPLCYHQFYPPATYKTQEAKAWAFAKWYPHHLVEYHQYKVRKSIISTCGCPACKSKRESSK